MNENNSFSFGKIVNTVINESLSRRAFHFTTLQHFYKMVDTDTIRFSESAGRDGIIQMQFGRNMPYFLSTTRVMDSRFGYSPGHNVRIELNTDAFNSNFHSGPVNFFKTDSNSYKDYYSGNGYYNDPTDPRGAQKFVESEDRIYSKKEEIHNIIKYIQRVDIYLPNITSSDFLKEKNFQRLKDLYSTSFFSKMFVYNNSNEFNKQGKNITDYVLKLIK